MLSAVAVDTYFAEQGSQERPIRKIVTHTKIVKLADEYVVRAYGKFGRIVSADYFTGGLGADYRKDAEDTARAMLAHR